MKHTENAKKRLPVHKRVVFWLVLPVVIIGLLITWLLVHFLSLPVESFLDAHFKANLRLSSKLGIGICDTHFNQLLDMRLEDNPEMNQALKRESLAEIRSMAGQVPNVHLLVVEKRQDIKLHSTDVATEHWQLPAVSSGGDTIHALQLGGEPVKAHVRYFPFWDWHIVSFVQEKEILDPLATARGIIFLSTLGVLGTVLVTLLVGFHSLIMRPVNRLVAGTQKISKGYFLPVVQSRQNEIGQLTVFFNRMVSSLRKKQGEVDSLIDQLKESEQRYRSLVELFPEAIFVHQSGSIVFCNSSGARLFGVGSAQELIGSPFVQLFHPYDQPKVQALIGQVHEQASLTPSREFRLCRRDDQTIDVELTGTVIEYAKETALLNVVRDISERKESEQEKRRLEEQFHQSQKLESIGRLAGGVAHDLNNLLSPILGYGELVLENDDLQALDREYLEEIVNAGRRARDLVRQLLAFSRKQTLEFSRIHLNELLENFEKLLRRTIREDIAIQMHLTESLPAVRGDVGQLEQVIMNLAVNAQDAMPEGGRLTLETGLMELDEDYTARHEGVAPGSYVLLAVTDNGQGMDLETRQRLFEPFYTTKAKDKGTGLGLATVYGIVKQHSGNIWVYSEPGQGTTVKVYLPVATEAEGSDPLKPPAQPRGVQGTETILLVEDDLQVRNLARTILEGLGYTVLAASGGEEALQLLETCTSEPHLLLTDVVMPNMDGRRLFELVVARIPGTRVLYMSGYTNNVIAHRGVLDFGVHFIQKPFSVQALALKVREVLEEKS
jgi:PAS domain S-box-containing protein